MVDESTELVQPIDSSLAPPAPVDWHRDWDPRTPRRLVYRGISSDEARSIAHSRFIESTLEFSLPRETTTFCQEYASAASYVNAGPTHPVHTGEPTYVIEVSSGPEFFVDPKISYYPMTTEPVPADRIRRAWRYDPNGSVVPVRLYSAQWRAVAPALPRSEWSLDKPMGPPPAPPDVQLVKRNVFHEYDRFIFRSPLGPIHVLAAPDPSSTDVQLYFAGYATHYDRARDDYVAPPRNEPTLGGKAIRPIRHAIRDSYPHATDARGKGFRLQLVGATAFRDVSLILRRPQHFGWAPHPGPSRHRPMMRPR